MSWTSSFLFAIQYAIYKSQHRHISHSDIRICIVNTKQFLRGQFARDVTLLNAHLAAAEALDVKIPKFFRFRLNNNDYYNGEYLSQGTVNHAGRSCIVSLEELEKADLCKLYPEFKPRRKPPQWANRVRDLREEWSFEQRTTDQEIQYALAIA